MGCAPAARRRRDSLTSVSGSGRPIDPGLAPPAGIAVEMPPDSVCPQTSTISSPSAMYQRKRSGEIGAAPVISSRARCTPITLRMLLRTSTRANQNAAASGAGTGLRCSRRFATRWPMPMATPYASCCSRLASLSLISTAE